MRKLIFCFCAVLGTLTYGDESSFFKKEHNIQNEGLMAGDPQRSSAVIEDSSQANSSGSRDSKMNKQDRLRVIMYQGDLLLKEYGKKDEKGEYYHSSTGIKRLLAEELDSEQSKLKIVVQEKGGVSAFFGESIVVLDEKNNKTHLLDKNGKLVSLSNERVVGNQKLPFKDTEGKTHFAVVYKKPGSNEISVYVGTKEIKPTGYHGVVYGNGGNRNGECVLGFEFNGGSYLLEGSGFKSVGYEATIKLKK